MDFEARYEAGEARPFDQRNEMYKRMDWDPKFEGMWRGFSGVIPADGRIGATNENMALRNAAWSVEQGYAKGVEGGQVGMLTWDDDYVIRGMARIDRNTPYDPSDAAHNTRVVKKAASFFGSALTGVSPLDRRWIYSKGYRLGRDRTEIEFDIDIPDSYQWVISMALPMDYEFYRYVPSYLASASTGHGYSKMAITAGYMAQFIRQLGFKAIPTGNDTAMSIPYAVQAGLGEMGRSGILITREYGPRVRLCKVFTDLPLVPGEPIEFGVMEFCGICQECAKQCPSQAIPLGPRSNAGHNICNSDGPLKWYVDGEACHMYWTKSRCDCGICIRVCPFNKPDGWLHETARWFVEHVPGLNRLMLKADTLCGYGKQHPHRDYWDR
jgi:reductive dehalogenase